MRDAKVFVSGVSSDFRTIHGTSPTSQITIEFDAGPLNEEIAKRLFPLLGHNCTLGDLVRALDGSEKTA